MSRLSVTSRSLLGASTAIACLLAAPATAQQRPSSDAAPAENAADQDVVIKEVVVTAQRRAENLQKTALSIQVLGSDVLQKAGATQANDLNGLVPGINVATIGSTVQISVRGVSDNSSTALSNSTVATSVDSVFIGRPTSITNSFFDVGRIEVLKGPQGTLYGRGASGGALNIITNAPNLGEDSGYFEGELGNYQQKRITAAFNKSLGDTFAFRVAFQDIDRNGYLSDGDSDQKSTAGRIRALWKPSDAVSLMLNFDAGNQRGRGSGAVLTPHVAGVDPWDGSNSATSAARILSATPPPLQFGLVYNGTSRADNSFLNASAQLDVNFGIATLTVIPAYRRVDQDTDGYQGILYSEKSVAKQESLEVRLSHASSSLKWVVGGFYYHESNVTSNVAQSSLIAIATSGTYSLPVKSYAAFGEATYSVTPALRVTGGIRYTSEPRSITGSTSDDTFPAAGSPPVTFSGQNTFTATTWKGGLEYDVSSSSMFFANVSTGFKSGGFNQEPDLPSKRNFFQPERLTAYVAGLRNRFLANTLQVNLEGFYYDYKDKQESGIAISNSGGVGFLTTNAANARIFGGSADIVWRATPSDTVSLFGEYNNNKYLAYSVPVQNGSPSGCVVTAGVPFAAADCSGKPLVKAPRWVATAAYNHVFTLASGATVAAEANGRYSSSYYTATEFLPGEFENGYAILNASLTLSPASKAWQLTAFVRNMTNTAYYLSSFAMPLQTPLVSSRIGDPRTFGGRLRINF